MSSLEERYNRGLEMRETMAAGDFRHFTLPGIDQLAPDLKRIVDEALFGSIWTRGELDIQQRCMCTLSALLTLGHLQLLRRHIERALNVGMAPEAVVEIFIQMTFYAGVPAVESAMGIAKEIFEERGIRFMPTNVYDSEMAPDDLHQQGIAVHEEHMGDITVYYTEDPDSPEMQLERLINEYNWGAIYSRPHLDAKARSMCALVSMTVMGQYDRQMRRRISAALRVGMTPAEIMEVLIQLTLYGGYFNTRTAMRIARSVFTEEGISLDAG
jgi:4-carboxymuconolactone decarboxylase